MGNTLEDCDVADIQILVSIKQEGIYNSIVQ